MTSNLSELVETLSLAKQYLQNLSSVKQDLDIGEKQVINSYLQTTKSIKQTFSNFRKSILSALETREKELLNRAEKIQEEALQPLHQSTKIVDDLINDTHKLIEDGSNLLKNPSDKVPEFLEGASLLGNLPEVLETKEVPSLSFYHEEVFESEITQMCSTLGEVFGRSPVQIHNIISKPGAVLIEWQYAETEPIRDIQEFKLQRAFGNVFKDKCLMSNFIDCYTGVNTQYLLRDIQISQPYSFRVCCKFEGATSWGPWSVPQVGQTANRWFTWTPADGVKLLNEDKIVTLEDSHKKLVISDGPQVALTDSIEFTILETDIKSDIILGLTVGKDEASSSFLIDSFGKITIDGAVKTTILPAFCRCLKVNFSLEPQYDKVRVNVDCQDKRVTYDWFIGDTTGLYFVCELAAKWKVMVE